MNNFLNLALPKFALIPFLFKKPLALIVVVPPTIVVSNVVHFESVGWFLFYLVIIDLVTGLLASYWTWKESDHKDRWFFGRGGKEGFSSDKAKKMGVKLVVYVTLPVMLIQLQQVLFLKKFKYERISDAEFELATLAVLFFCLIEGFSIFHENLPKCGFDLWKILKKILGFAKEVKKEISE